MTTTFYDHWRDVPEGTWRWPNFSAAEIACRGTVQLKLHPAALDKLQALQLRRSPLDRWLGTATLTLDTAGAGAGPALQLQFLPEAEARAVVARLSRALARRKLRW